MHTILLNELNISVNDDLLYLHRFINAQFELKPSFKQLIDAKKWLKFIIIKNQDIKIYNQLSFQDTAKKKWNRLFYLIVPFGFKTVFYYILITGIKFEQFNYYIKYVIKVYQTKLIKNQININQKSNIKKLIV